MNLTDLIEKIKNDCSINFIGMAITPLQATGIDAVTSYLSNKGVKLNGYILMTAHPNTGRILNRNNFTTHYDGLEYLDFDCEFPESQGFLKQLQVKSRGLSYTKRKKKGETIYLVWTEILSNLMYVLSESRPEANVTFIQIDDGAASYINDFQLRLSNLLLGRTYDGIELVVQYTKAGFYAILSKLMRKNLKCKNRYIDATIFIKKIDIKGKMLEQNSTIIPYYVEAFKQQGFMSDKILKYEHAVIVNTQCLSEGNITNGVVDLEVYKSLTKIINDLGYKIILKPHPREKDIEKYQKLRWELTNDISLTQESILACLENKPKCIISIYSSTLLNARGLFGIPAISLAKLMLEKQISKSLRIELNRYIKMYNSVIYFPSTKLELKNIIRDIMEKEKDVGLK